MSARTEDWQRLKHQRDAARRALTALAADVDVPVIPGFPPSLGFPEGFPGDRFLSGGATEAQVADAAARYAALPAIEQQGLTEQYVSQSNTALAASLEDE